ncbi:hypothetical protein QO003_003826 [Arthrobacter silviterrae]|uniref:PepSY domain-containing protein n=1 Tax=Arthrobacter silviterrae TaxID=2026658 RepID=A0ABX0D946_9MICC|nr:hypothetical protein [Arthrobacter silviterrae]MDQ0279523.1 hypothetical protein [Arthrobacter silviterrae]NGN82000.1 hypothetical protein [Arthrobacter silviterrae]
MNATHKHIKRKVGLWSMASLAGVALVGVGVSPLIAASSPSTDLPPAPGPVPSLSKQLPQEQTPTEFQQALGVPLEDAGGGTHAVLEQDAQAAKASLIAGGYTVNQITLNYAPMSADIYIAGKTPTATAQSAARSKANGAAINFVAAARTTAEAEVQQARIDADRDALAKQGIKINTTGILEDGSTILVRLINGTSAQADYILKTYGPDGLKVDTAAGPQPQES